MPLRRFVPSVSLYISRNNNTCTEIVILKRIFVNFSRWFATCRALPYFSFFWSCSVSRQLETGSAIWFLCSLAQFYSQYGSANADLATTIAMRYPRISHSSRSIINSNRRLKRYRWRFRGVIKQHTIIFRLIPGAYSLFCKSDLKYSSYNYIRADLTNDSAKKSRMANVPFADIPFLSIILYSLA